METTKGEVELSPSIVMIDGRKYALYDEFVGRIRVVPARMLWVDAALPWAYALLAWLWLTLPGSPASVDQWGAFGILLLALVALFTGRAEVGPVAVVETGREGSAARLAVTTRRHSTLTATVHTDMADYLLGASSADRRRRFMPRWEVPAHLAEPAMRRLAWISTAGGVVALSLVTSLFVREFVG